MASIFGPSPQELNTAIRQADQDYINQNVTADAPLAISRAMANAGQSFGRAAGALGGFKDPRVQKAMLMEEAKQEVESSGVDLLSDSQGYYKAAAEALAKRGLMDEAMAVRNIAIQEQATLAKAQLDQAKALGEQGKGLKGRFAQNAKGQVIDSWTGQVVKEDSEEYEAATASAKAYQDYINGAYGDPATTEAQQRYQAAIDKINYRRPPSNVSVSTRGESKFIETVAKGTGEEFLDVFSRSRNANQILENVDTINTLLDSSDVIVGPGADIRLGLAKLMNIAGANNEDSIAQTQVLLSRLAQTTLNAIPDSNLGGGQGFTERDKQFLEAASAGDFTWTKESLRYINWINSNRARNLIKQRNELIQNKTPKQLDDLELAGVDIRIKPLPNIGPRPVWEPKENTSARSQPGTRKIFEGWTQEEIDTLTEDEYSSLLKSKTGESK